MAEHVDASNLQKLAADLKGLDDRKEIVKALRKTIREPVPALRKAIRESALDRLPATNGLNRWVAGSLFTVQIKVTTGRTAGITLKGGRNSGSKSTSGKRKRSDIRAIDRGKVRAPSWGHRGRNAWHNQAVKPGFFTDTVEGFKTEFGTAADAAIATVLRELKNRG
jgi:hypothetical protein